MEEAGLWYNVLNKVTSGVGSHQKLVQPVGGQPGSKCLVKTRQENNFGTS